MTRTTDRIQTLDLTDLARRIKDEALRLGFQAAHIGMADTESHRADYEAWLATGHHGTMDWMTRNMDKRFDGAELHPGTLRAISVRLDYLPVNAADMEATLEDPSIGYVSRYALGRDYHKLMRKRLTQLGRTIGDWVGEHNFRAFVDSAPVMERQLAEQSGMGWRGKHSLLLNPKAGSWFFLGELFTDLPLPVDPPFETDHCGSCTSCQTVCPTDAIVADGVVDARRCISYLTIEHAGPIPEHLRKPMGNRIYGCDDCQLYCPFNRFSETTREADFEPRQALDHMPLTTLIDWNEAEFLSKTEGSAIRRIGHEQWQRNLAVALGNAPTTNEVVEALRRARTRAGDLVREHIDWALAQHGYSEKS
ncbi:tRNA epoxyqueuosine(34) reductase QueG [Saccharospirillum salsuginis]|uniref:Epoxyqueuosine reductase n=1 Tax=Saccharospirillum salsuginis TaxID=418750 RepID=A0A918K308_9GAMM|nr:tRNA epoxyqueuosine(34) reductase QueG [Saccharospirillum salsuginis]GGX40757.1 epoxyqueuosine reductase [Saccharospirillum salsuginis]